MIYLYLNIIFKIFFKLIIKYYYCGLPMVTLTSYGSACFRCSHKFFILVLQYDSPIITYIYFINILL